MKVEDLNISHIDTSISSGSNRVGISIGCYVDGLRKTEFDVVEFLRLVAVKLEVDPKGDFAYEPKQPKQPT